MGVRSAALRSHRVSLPLSPPSLRSCPPSAPFGRCPGAVCAPSLGGGVYAPPSSLAPFGSGGSLLAPLRPAQGLARPWANVALPPSLLSARGGDGAGLCVSRCPVLCSSSQRCLHQRLVHRKAEKAGRPSRPARFLPASALRPHGAVFCCLVVAGAVVMYRIAPTCRAPPPRQLVSLYCARARGMADLGPKKCWWEGVVRARARAT